MDSVRLPPIPGISTPGENFGSLVSRDNTSPVTASVSETVPNDEVGVSSDSAATLDNNIDAAKSRGGIPGETIPQSFVRVSPRDAPQKNGANDSPVLTSLSQRRPGSGTLQSLLDREQRALEVEPGVLDDQVPQPGMQHDLVIGGQDRFRMG